MFKTILVALDESEVSHKIMGALEQIHLAPTAKIILSHVLPDTGNDLELAADLPQTYAEEIPYRHIEKLLQKYQQELPCTSELEIVTGDPAEEIIRLSHIYECDLIVIGCRGLKGMRRILEGSVSSEVVADAPCSVLVVNPQ
ncbi:universal stress protein [Merismopedia glauca]|uniref:Universal stress protein n=1 Tax=Merismopedia glauca CCAP 1448/3 TaxID=1296344 RepID=A0A2T1CAK1_9CYAN|nr:universal stress protein [Merismopedia glauca]PSB05173.1 universal stress protein [Merismopedia glauca CCAP 1448/3]